MSKKINQSVIRFVTHPFISQILDANNDLITKEIVSALLSHPPLDFSTNYDDHISNQTFNISNLIEHILSSEQFSKESLVRISPVIIDHIYESFLGRPADNNGKIHFVGLLGETGRLDTVLTAFIGSPEFRAKQDITLPFMELSIPKEVNEYLATDEQLRAISEKIKAAWEHLGRTRAHHSVLTSESFLPEELGNNITEFWSSGYQELSLIEKLLDRHEKSLKKDIIAVEYGCGVGRITAPIAKNVAFLHAYDISAPHLEYAKEHMKEVEVENVTFHQVTDPLTPLQKCDFFYSRIVFQHNPPPIIHQLFKNALSSLNPGGVAIIQVPTFIRGHSFVITEWLGNDHLLDMQMHYLSQAAIFKLIYEMGCSLLEVREDNSCGDPQMYLSNTFVITKNVF